MRQAPAASFPVERPILAGWGILVVWVMGVISSVSLGLNGAQSAWSLPVGLCVSLIAGLSALIWWRKSPVGQLRWDRNQWVFVASKNDSKEPLAFFDVAVALDFQSSLLVSFRTISGSRNWFWLERRTDPAAWRILRRAIFARPRNAPALVPIAANAARSAPE